MAIATPEPGARLPDLGARGIGWVALQFTGLAWVALAPRWSAAWPGPLETASRLGGILLFLAGGVLFGASLRALGRSLTALPAPKRSATLITAGPYARARHPIYGGVILGCLGWSLLWTSPEGLVATAATALVLVLKSLKEESWLVERYPDYPAYRARTRRFFPLP